MSEELIVLMEYMDILGINQDHITIEDLSNLKEKLLKAEEFGLAQLVKNLSGPEELLEYVGK